jgi:hypothetical protein
MKPARRSAGFSPAGRRPDWKSRRLVDGGFGGEQCVVRHPVDFVERTGMLEKHRKVHRAGVWLAGQAALLHFAKRRCSTPRRCCTLRSADVPRHGAAALCEVQTSRRDVIIC